MKVLVIGGSRGIGRQTVIEALQKGHSVTAFARNVSALDIKHANLRLQSGDVLDYSTLEKAVSGNDVVICALGLTTRQAIGPPLSKASYVLSTGTKNIVKAMNSKHVKRLVCVTAIGSGDSVSQCSLLTRLTLRYGLIWLFKEKDSQEELIKSSLDIDWTIIRPTALTNGRKKGVSVNNNLRAGFLTHVSRADVAAYMVDTFEQKNTYKKALIVSYTPKLGDSVRWLASYLCIS